MFYTRGDNDYIPVEEKFLREVREGDGVEGIVFIKREVASSKGLEVRKLLYL